MPGCVIETTHRLERTLFSRRKSLAINGDVHLRSHSAENSYAKFLALAEQLIRHFILPAVGFDYRGAHPVDLHMLRGEPREVLRSTSRPSADRPRESMLLLRGALSSLDGALDSAAEEDLEAEPFYYEIQTEFDRFDEQQNIIYRTHSESCLKYLSNSLPLGSLTRIVPVEFEELDLNLHYFRRRDLGLGIALTPIVEHTVSIRLTSSKMKIGLKWNGLNGSDSFQREVISGPALSSLQKALSSADWCANFSDHFKKLPFNEQSGSLSSQCS